MKFLVYKTLESVRTKLNPEWRKGCFEILGFDFMVDADLTVWLIECNTNPCIEESSQLLKMLLPRMLDDAFKLTLDRQFATGGRNSKSQFIGIAPPGGYKNVGLKRRDSSKGGSNEAARLSSRHGARSSNDYNPNLSQKTGALSSYHVEGYSGY